MILVAFIIGGLLGFFISALLTSNRKTDNEVLRIIWYILNDIRTGKTDLESVLDCIERGDFKL